MRYFREVEVKHGRVAMLGALGFLVGENFHPLFGGDIDVPSYVAFQETPLQTFWPSVVGTIGVFEFFSIAQVDGGFTIKDTFQSGEKREAGDFMFDPLGLKPKDAAALKNMQEKARMCPVACAPWHAPCGIRPAAYALLDFSSGGGMLGFSSPFTCSLLLTTCVTLLLSAGAQQRPSRDDRHGRHGRAGACLRLKALLSVRVTRNCPGEAIGDHGSAFRAARNYPGEAVGSSRIC